MNIDKRWILIAAAAGATVIAAVASNARRRDSHSARVLEHATDLKSWENEGGNLAPAAAAPP